MVDDNEVIGNTVVKFLRRAGYEAEAFANGADLLRLLEAQPADRVISDSFMPEIDGIELLLALCKRVPRLPVIVMSGGSRYWPLSLATAKQLGAVANMVKPFVMTEVLAAVQATIGAAGQPS